MWNFLTFEYLMSIFNSKHRSKQERKYYWRAPNGKTKPLPIQLDIFFHNFKSIIFAISSFSIIYVITSADQPTYVLLWVIFLVSAFSYQMSCPRAKLSQFGHTAFHWNLMHLLWVSVVLRSSNWLLKYGSEEKGSSLYKCSILLGFILSKNLRGLWFYLLTQVQNATSLVFLT